MSYVRIEKIAAVEHPVVPSGDPKTYGYGEMKPGPRPKLRHCAHCRRRFVVNPRSGKRHRHCSRPACVQARQDTAQKKWLKMWRKEHGGESYFAGKERLENARAWRARNPQYWKRTRRSPGARSGKIRLTRKLAAALRIEAS